jgi:hypothetical protein
MDNSANFPYMETPGKFERWTVHEGQSRTPWWHHFYNPTQAEGESGKGSALSAQPRKLIFTHWNETPFRSWSTILTLILFGQRTPFRSKTELLFSGSYSTTLWHQDILRHIQAMQTRRTSLDSKVPRGTGTKLVDHWPVSYHRCRGVVNNSKPGRNSSPVSINEICNSSQTI